MEQQITKEEALKVLAEERKKKVQSMIEEKSERAASVMHEVMDSEDVPPIVRVTAAKDILDRAGFKPVEKQVIAHTFPKPILDLPKEVIPTPNGL